MKRRSNILLTALLALVALGMEAKPLKTDHLYMFGFSASFQDSIVYLTDIQDVQGAWIDHKTKFLLGRDNYSYQLKMYFNEHQLKDRVCMVLFATSKKKAEKMYLKLRKKYLPGGKKKKKGQEAAPAYDVRYVTLQEFKFEPIDMSPEQ